MPSAGQVAVKQETIGEEVWLTESAQLLTSSGLHGFGLFVAQSVTCKRSYLWKLNLIYFWNTGFLVNISFLCNCKLYKRQDFHSRHQSD